jgi:hypothetical protein
MAFAVHSILERMRRKGAVRFRGLAWGALAAWLGAWPVAASSAESASGVILYEKVDATTFRYDIDLKNTGSTPIGTLWYSWIPVPSEDFMGVRPTNIAAPAGWNATVTNNGANDGFAIMFVNASGPLMPGQTLLGFSFDSTETPANLGSNSPFFPTNPIGTTFIYSAGPFSDGGVQFQIHPTDVPRQNPFSALDVDNNGAIQPHDAALVINALIKGGPRPLEIPSTTDAIPPFVDVHGDNVLSPADAIAVINHLITTPLTLGAAALAAGPDASSLTSASRGPTFSAMQPVPEPSSFGLLAAGALLWLGPARIRAAFARVRASR